MIGYYLKEQKKHILADEARINLYYQSNSVKLHNLLFKLNLFYDKLYIAQNSEG